MMATPVKKWLLRVALVFTGGHRGGVATGLLGWLAIDAYFALTGRSGDGVLTLFASGELWQHLAISSWRALIGFQLADRWD